MGRKMNNSNKNSNNNKDLRLILKAMDLCELYSEMRMTSMMMTEYEVLMHEQCCRIVETYMKSKREISENNHENGEG